MITEEIVHDVLDKLRKRIEQGEKVTHQRLNKYLQKTTGKDLMEFAKFCVQMFKKKKLEWQDLDVLETEVTPYGHDLIPQSFFENQLDEPHLWGRLPTPLVDRMKHRTSTRSLRREILATANMVLATQGVAEVLVTKGGLRPAEAEDLAVLISEAGKKYSGDQLKSVIYDYLQDAVPSKTGRTAERLIQKLIMLIIPMLGKVN